MVGWIFPRCRLPSCLLSFAILLSGLSSRHWSCHVFQQEEKSSRNHLWKLLSCLHADEAWGIAIKDLSIYPPPGTSSGFCNCLVTKAVSAGHCFKQLWKDSGRQKALSSTSCLCPWGRKRTGFAAWLHKRALEKKWQIERSSLHIETGVRLQRFRQAARMWRLRSSPEQRKSSLTHRWNCLGRPWSTVGSTLQKELCEEYVMACGDILLMATGTHRV